MNTQEKKHICLTQEERATLKNELKEIWPELPVDLKEFILESSKQKLKTLYMLKDWAIKHNHETMVDLLSRKIECKEERIKKMESSI